MPHTTWVTPQFRELNLSSEIGSYFEEEEEVPSFLAPLDTQLSAKTDAAEQAHAAVAYAAPGRQPSDGAGAERVSACE
jgi:hypothetical protein